MIGHIFYLCFVAATVSIVHGWSRHPDLDRWTPSRRSFDQCVKLSGKCFASGECCMGYVCAAYDDKFGLKPEIPGYCVKEKDLRMCDSSADCYRDERCKQLSGEGLERYCISRRAAAAEEEEEEVEKLLAAANTLQNEVGGKDNSAFGDKGLGGDCEKTSDCRAFTKDGNDRLCCQKVRRYRQKTKIMCDRVTTLSSCLP